MIKVLCIDGDFSYQMFDKPWPIFMETYTVIQEVVCNCGCNLRGYVLEEMQENIPWLSGHFIPVENKLEHSIELDEQYACP